jgi:ABC-type sugar transport system ATPase subunit
MIELRDVRVRAGALLLDSISFQVGAGEHVVLMGRTGAGKTTLLEAVSGLRKIDRGQIRIGDRDVTALDPADRQIGYVPQDRALFPTLTVREHLAFALRVRKRPASVIEARVAALAQLLGIESLLARKPAGLSGGESQRVALGRALAGEPPVLLLDEPLSALDEETRADIRKLLADIRVSTGVSMLHVTHDRADAEALADRILLLKDGRVS